MRLPADRSSRRFARYLRLPFVGALDILQSTPLSASQKDVLVRSALGGGKKGPHAPTSNHMPFAAHGQLQVRSCLVPGASQQAALSPLLLTPLVRVSPSAVPFRRASFAAVVARSSHWWRMPST